MLETIAENIWAHNDDMRLGGVPLPLRMTIIKLASGELWLHSPTKISPQLMEQINTLGQLSYIIAPNNGHNLWLEQWQAAYPNAKIFVSSGIPKKLPQLRNYTIIESQDTLPWQNDIALASMPSVNFFDEQVFFHHASKSLIVTDLIQNHSEQKLTGLKAKLNHWILKKIGFNGICIAPPLKAPFTIKDKLAFKAFIQNILAWQFDRVIVTHGDIISDEPKKTLEQCFQRFLN